MGILIDYACHVANTVTAMYQQPFLKEWDDLLNKIIDEGLVVEVTELTIKFNYEGEEWEVWVGNRWYAYAHLWRKGDRLIQSNEEFRPRFRTMRRLRDLHLKLHEAQRGDALIKIYGLGESWK
ncbi:hypothetical protein ACENW9_000836 [Escherichia coli]